MSIELRELFPQARWKVGRLAEDGDNTLETESLVDGKNADNKTLAYIDERRVEDGRTLDVIFTHPQSVNNGTIKGFFPWVPLPNNALFETEVGFSGVPENRTTVGKVTFQVWEHHYENNKRVWNKIASVPKEYNRSLQKISASLNHLKRKGIHSVSIELRVDAGSTAAQDLAVWVHPRIIDSYWEDGGLPKKLTIQFGDQPLKHFYVAETNGLGTDIAMRRTDHNGHVFINRNEDSVRVYYQNNVVRMLQGSIFHPEISQHFDNVKDGMVIRLAPESWQQDSIDVALKSQDVYNKVWRNIYPFNQPGRRAFPYGHANSIDGTRNSHRRFEIQYPDTSPTPLSWVDPANLQSAAGIIPFMHLKEGENGLVAGSKNTLVHEMAHGFHFASLPGHIRHQARNTYFGWIITNLHDPTHRFSKKTTPFIAFIECIGIFADLYYKYATDSKNRNKTVSELQKGFIKEQKDSFNYRNYKGSDIEGAVFGGIFVDFADRVGFDLAIGEFFMCRELSFDGYRKQVRKSNRFSASQKGELDDVARDWGL